MSMAEARVKPTNKNKQYCIAKEQHCLTLNYGKAMLFFLVLLSINKKLVWSHNRYISFYKILFISSQNNIDF